MEEEKLKEKIIPKEFLPRLDALRPNHVKRAVLPIHRNEGRSPSNIFDVSTTSVVIYIRALIDTSILVKNQQASNRVQSLLTHKRFVGQPEKLVNKDYHCRNRSEIQGHTSCLLCISDYNMAIER